jgi:transcriptional regulator with XRE-family HTH domain
VDIVQPNFGVRIRKLRLDRGLSQSQLADLIGLSEDQISNIERGKSWVGEQTLALLAAALQVKTVFIVRLHGERQVPEEWRTQGAGFTQAPVPGCPP